MPAKKRKTTKKRAMSLMQVHNVITDLLLRVDRLERAVMAAALYQSQEGREILKRPVTLTAGQFHRRDGTGYGKPPHDYDP